MRTLIKPLRWNQVLNLGWKNAFRMTSMKPNLSLEPWKPQSLNGHLRYSFATDQTQHKNIVKSSYEASGYYVEQILTGCLAIYSYYIESGDECIIIDPLFDTNHYVELINSRGKKLKGIFISHYHADYVSGQYELQKKYGCKIYMGPTAIASDAVVPLKDQ